jgi:hypothetical protein
MPNRAAGGAATPDRATDETTPDPATSPVVVMARVRPVRIAPDDAAEPGAAPRFNSIEALLEEPGASGHGPPRPLRWMAASTGTPPPAEQASEAFSGRSAFGLAASPGPGSPPSTLGAQAASLARRHAAVAAPEPAAPAAAGGFQIQVGAYRSEGEAQRRLAEIARRASSLVGDRTGVTQQVKLDGKLYYRARYVGFDGEAVAARACTELKRLNVDCFVLGAE